MPAVEVPVASVGVRGVQIFDEVVPFADEEVVAEHYAHETAHEDTHTSDARQEDGTGDEHFPWHHTPATDYATDNLAAYDVDVSRGHSRRVDAEGDQIGDEVGADLTDHEDEGYKENGEFGLGRVVFCENGVEDQGWVPDRCAVDLARASCCNNAHCCGERSGPGSSEKLTDDLVAGTAGVASDIGYLQVSISFLLKNVVDLRSDAIKGPNSPLMALFTAPTMAQAMTA